MTHVYIEDYINAVEFLDDAFEHKSEFSKSQILSITPDCDYKEVIRYLHDLETYRRYRKVKIDNELWYSNISPRETRKILDNLIELEAIRRSSSILSRHQDDPQDLAHEHELKSLIDSLKKDIGY